MSRFYAELPVLTDFSAVTQPERFAPLPADWHVATCDVRNSTAAVQAGNYKHVNTVAAAAVTAVLNAAGETEIPFVFEGDGSAFCVPPALLEDARAALAKTRDMARDSFGLDLRVATVPVARVREAGLRHPGRALPGVGELRPGGVRRRRHGLGRPLHEGSGDRGAVRGRAPAASRRAAATRGSNAAGRTSPARTARR